MKILLLPLCAAVLAATSLNLCAQDAPPPAGGPGGGPGGGGGRMERMLGTLTPEEKTEYTTAHDKALADNPDLKAEQDALRTGRPDKSAPAADKQAYMAKMKDHSAKMNAALLKADPNIQPVLDKIQKAREEMRAKRAAGGGAGA